GAVHAPQRAERIDLLNELAQILVRFHGCRPREGGHPVFSKNMGPSLRGGDGTTLFIRQIERAIDHLGRALEVVMAVSVHLHDERRAAVKLLVLLMATA